MFFRDKELTRFNFYARWLWDDDVISNKMVTANVATILVDKLRRFDETSQTVLKVASCLGSTFSVPATEAVARTLISASTETASHDGETEAVSLASLVDKFEREGLWEREGDLATQCHFTHDQVQSAAFELVPVEERDMFRGTVGKKLMNLLDPESLEDNLFEVVSLANYEAAYISAEKRNELARLNIKAGLKASSVAAFDAAILAVKVGKLTLALCCSCAVRERMHPLSTGIWKQ